MARAVRKIVQVDRLRDQVYGLIRADLNAGLFTPGQRIIEAELAARYEVSRTPVREALFQLSREGVLAAANDRGYEIPVDTRELARNRHEVRDLLDPAMVRHSAAEGTPDQRKRLAKACEKMAAMHATAKLGPFIDANVEFRGLLREMCGNELLAKCSALVDDQAQFARRSAFADADNRAIELRFSELLTDAIGNGNGAAAEEAMRDYIATVRSWSANLPD